MLDLSTPLLGYPLLVWLVLLVVAVIGGAIGQALVGYSPGGCLIALIVGFLGAWLGIWVASQFALPPLLTIYLSGQPFPIVWAALGALVFAIVLGLVTQRLIVEL